MALNSINTNVAAYFAQQNINKANGVVSGSVGRLSSGNRIVRASDDVAAMSVGTSLRTTVSTLKMGLLNASQGSSMLQVADGALGKMQDMLLRQKALATQATSGSLTSAERGFLNQEFQNLTQEIDRLVQNTNFNGVNLLGGGLGTTADLASTAAIAGAMDPTAATNDSTSEASTLAIQGFDQTDGSVVTAGAGFIQLVDGANVALAGSDFLNVNGAVGGGIESFKFTNVNTGAAAAGNATLTITMGGVEFTGSVTGGSTTLYVQNGSTRLELTSTALSFADANATENSLNQLYSDFADTVMMSATTVQGVSFAGTGLDDVVGAAGTGVAMLRTTNPGNVDIGNFQYVSRSGADENTLTVQVNGETWVATGVTDDITTATNIVFEKGNGEALLVRFTGLDANSDLDLENSVSDRSVLVNALNTAFGNAGGGVDFALGTERSDSLRVQIQNASSASLYGGQALDVTTVASAQAAGEALNSAIEMVTSIRADVGATMSRFDFASANIEISLQNQDAARGTLLDTDVAAESSAYATAQVQLQAGIAVLAQANQLPQNLLKLIG